MQRANADLERERQAGRLGERDIEALGEGDGGYIEMDLGLGVLEEKGARYGSESESESESGSESESESEGEGGTDGEDDDGAAEWNEEVVKKETPECEEGGSRAKKGGGRRKERGVLARLMGEERRTARPSIEVV